MIDAMETIFERGEQATNQIPALSKEMRLEGKALGLVVCRRKE
jgi:hypothetical protein